MANKYGILLLMIVALFAIMYFLIGPLEPIMLLLYSAMLVYALGEKCGHLDLLSNSLVTLLSRVSMEIYLSHMFIFRVVEKCVGGLLTGLPGVAAFLITALITISGTVAFSVMMRKTKKWMDRRC